MKRLWAGFRASGAAWFFLVVGALVTGEGSDNHDIVTVVAGAVLLAAGVALKALQVWREATAKRST